MLALLAIPSCMTTSKMLPRLLSLTKDQEARDRLSQLEDQVRTLQQQVSALQKERVADTTTETQAHNGDAVRESYENDGGEAFHSAEASHDNVGEVTVKREQTPYDQFCLIDQIPSSGSESSLLHCFFHRMSCMYESAAHDDGSAEPCRLKLHVS